MKQNRQPCPICRNHKAGAPLKIRDDNGVSFRATHICNCPYCGRFLSENYTDDQNIVNADVNICTDIYCFNEQCRFHDRFDRCRAESVVIYAGECDTFEDYMDTAEYSEKYYICVAIENGGRKKVQAKAVKHGKRLEINNHVFYTDSPPDLDEHRIYLTHGRTGRSCGTVAYIKDRFEDFLRIEEKTRYKDVSSLPLAEFDDKERRYFLVDEQATEKEG